MTLTLIGGKCGPDYRISVFMREGYDRPCMSIDKLYEIAGRWTTNFKFEAFPGDPWTIYVRKVMRS